MYGTWCLPHRDRQFYFGRREGEERAGRAGVEGRMSETRNVSFINTRFRRGKQKQKASKTIEAVSTELQLLTLRANPVRATGQEAVRMLAPDDNHFGSRF